MASSMHYLQWRHLKLLSPPSARRSSCPTALRSLPCTATGCRDFPTSGALTDTCGTCQDTRSPAANAAPLISMVDTSIPVPTHIHILCLTLFPFYVGRCRGQQSMVLIPLFPCNGGGVFHDEKS